MPNAHFMSIQNRFLTMVQSPLPQYWAIRAPPPPTTAPLNRLMMNAIWFARETAETASCVSRPSISASDAPIRATSRFCIPIGIARENSSL